MATRIPASQRTREELTALIEGRLSTASATGLRPAGLERIRDRLPICRRHRRTITTWRQARTGSGRLGLYGEGRRVLLHLMARSKEDTETVTAFFDDMKRRGLNDPLLVRVKTLEGRVQ
jgi:hypothetical protein